MQRRQLELALIARRGREAIQGGQRIGDDPAVRERHRRRPELRVGRRDACDDRTGPPTPLQRVVGRQVELPRCVVDRREADHQLGPLGAARPRVQTVVGARHPVVVELHPPIEGKRVGLDERRGISRLPRPLEMAPGAREASEKLELCRLLRGEDFERVVDGIVPLVGGQQEDVVLGLVAIPSEHVPVVDGVGLDERRPIPVVAVDVSDVNRGPAGELMPIAGGPLVHVGLVIIRIEDAARIERRARRRHEHGLEAAVPIQVVLLA